MSIPSKTDIKKEENKLELITNENLILSSQLTQLAKQMELIRGQKDVALLKIKDLELTLNTKVRKVYNVVGLKGILDTMYEIISSIKFENPLTLVMVRELGMDVLQNTVYKRCLSLFAYRFKVVNSKDMRARVSACITELQKIWDKSIKARLLTAYKSYELIVVRGALIKFYSMINPFTDELVVKSKDSMQILKLFSAVETNLSSLSSIETELYPKVEENIINAFEKLGNEKREQFITAYYDPKYIMECEHNVREATLRYLLADRDMILRPSEIVAIFERLSETLRTQFLEMVSKILLPSEKRTILSQLGVKLGEQ